MFCKHLTCPPATLPWFWRGANLISSRNFVCVGSLSVWRGADFCWFSEILEEISYEFSLEGPCMTILQRSFMAILEVHDVWRSWAGPCRGPCEQTWRSWWNHDLVQVLIRCRSWWHLLRGPCVILNRSQWEDLVGILVRSSLPGPCMILYRSLVRRSCGDPGRILSKRLLHEDLAGAMC